jgi:hypothetical protein
METGPINDELDKRFRNEVNKRFRMKEDHQDCNGRSYGNVDSNGFNSPPSMHHHHKQTSLDATAP